MKRHGVLCYKANKVSWLYLSQDACFGLSVPSFWVSVFSNTIIYVLNYTPSNLPPHSFVSFPNKHRQIIYNCFLLVEFVYLVS